MDHLLCLHFIGYVTLLGRGGEGGGGRWGGRVEGGGGEGGGRWGGGREKGINYSASL